MTQVDCMHPLNQSGLMSSEADHDLPTWENAVVNFVPSCGTPDQIILEHIHTSRQVLNRTVDWIKRKSTYCVCSPLQYIFNTKKSVTFHASWFFIRQYMKNCTLKYLSDVLFQTRHESYDRDSHLYKAEYRYRVLTKKHIHYIYKYILNIPMIVIFRIKNILNVS